MGGSAKYRAAKAAKLANSQFTVSDNSMLGVYATYKGYEKLFEGSRKNKSTEKTTADKEIKKAKPMTQEEADRIAKINQEMYPSEKFTPEQMEVKRSAAELDKKIEEVTKSFSETHNETITNGGITYFSDNPKELAEKYVKEVSSLMSQRYGGKYEIKEDKEYGGFRVRNADDSFAGNLFVNKNTFLQNEKRIAAEKKAKAEASKVETTVKKETKKKSLFSRFLK